MNNLWDFCFADCEKLLEDILDQRLPQQPFVFDSHFFHWFLKVMLVPLKDYSKTGSCIEPKYGVVRLCIRDMQKRKNKTAVIQKINIASFNQKAFQPVLYDYI